MDDSSNRKAKEQENRISTQQMISDDEFDQTLSASRNPPTYASSPPPHLLPVPQPIKMDLVQEFENLSLTPGQKSPPSHLSTLSFKRSLPVHLRLMKPRELVQFKRTGHVQSTTKKRRDNRGWGRTLLNQTLHIPFGFEPGLSPYEKVQETLTKLKEFITKKEETETMTEYSAQAISLQPLSFLNPVKDRPTSTSSSSFTSGARNVGSLALGSSSAAMDMDKAAWTVEEVLGMVEEYLKNVSRTVSAEEVEEGLLAIQRRVGVSPLPTWYGLMNKSHIVFWEYLTCYFECPTLKASVKSGHEEGDEFDNGSSDANSSAP